MATANMMKNIQKQQERFFYKVHTSPSAQRVYIGGIDAKHKKGLSEQVTTTKQFSVQFIKKENICDHCKQIIQTEIEELWKNYNHLLGQNELLRQQLVSLKEIIHENQRESLIRFKMRTQTSESSEDKFHFKKFSLQNDYKDSLSFAKPSDKLNEADTTKIDVNEFKLQSYQNSPNLLTTKFLRGLQHMRTSQSPEGHAKIYPYILQKINYQANLGSPDQKFKTQAIW